VAAGAWLAKYRFVFMPLTFSLLAFSIYRTHFGPCVAPLRRKIILWATAVVSVGLTVYSLVK